jgi:nucleotide-binding universal stress UspA family protein
MADYRRICCATDFTEASRFAMLEAVELAHRFGAELELVHVHAPLSAIQTDMLVGPAELGDDTSANAEESMRAWREEAERLLGRPVASTVLPGDAAGRLGTLARDRPFDLIVAGTRGRRGVKRLVLGSVVERIVREAPCAVLVVRPQHVRVREEAAGARLHLVRLDD